MENWENCEVNKILDFKKEGNQFIYLVKWKGLEEQDWLSVYRFNEIINDFHAELEEKKKSSGEKTCEKKKLLRKEKAERVQPYRISSKKDVN